MKKGKGLGGLFLMFILILAMTVPASGAGSVQISRKSMSLYAGQSAKLKVKGTKKKVKWSTTNKRVAAVNSSTGKITAKKAGKATIKAKVSGKTLSCKLTVKKECLNRTKLSLGEGRTVTLKLNGGSIKAAKSSAPSVASVTKKGKVTAKKAGNATITVTSSTKKKYTCKVVVLKPSLSRTSAVVAKGDYVDLKLKNGTVRSAESSDDKIAEVFLSQGRIRVTGVKKGSVKITVRDSNRKLYNCNVSVEEPVFNHEFPLTLNLGEVLSLQLAGNTQKVSWYTSNSVVASVDSSGKVTANSIGAAIISARVGHIAIECEIVVRDTYTIRFDTLGGSAVSPQSIKEGGLVQKPADPTKEQCLFMGWYTDSGCTIAYDFGSPVRRDMVLYAKWQERQVFNVTFDTQGGSTVEAQKIAEGDAAKKPSDPTRNQYIFGGWYTDSACTAAYDFGSPVKGNITLYAKWSPSILVITFNSSGGSAVDTQNIHNGTKAIRPENPLKSGFIFDNWYTDSACTTVYNFDTIPTSDMTLYAKWIPLEVKINLAEAQQYEKTDVARAVKGSVQTNGVISSISYTLKGSHKEKTEEIPQVNAADFKYDILLEAGDNTFEVTVETLDGTIKKEHLSMNYDSGSVYDVTDSSIVKKNVTAQAEEGQQDPEITPQSDFPDEEINKEMEVPVNEEIGTLSQAVNSAGDSSTKEVYYVTNLFNLYFNSGVRFSEKENFVKDVLKGEVAGYLSALDMMQVKFTGELPALDNYEGQLSPTGISMEELQTYAEKMAAQYQSNGLKSVEVEFFYDTSAQAVETNDPWGGNKADNSWWIQRIGANEAWKYDNYENLDFLRDISLGVVDAGFDKGHEELKDIITILSSEDSAHDHGTHVAGIMAAQADNNRGISGIMHNNSSLLVYDAEKASVNGMSDSQIIEGLTKTVESGAKVVNFSLGASSCALGTGMEESFINRQGSKYSESMGKLLEKGFDFVVVQSAGNGNKSGVGIDYRNNGGFCSINKDNCYSDDNVSADEIINRILVVSCTDSQDNMTDFSNGGNGDLYNIAAPGADIYSAVCGNSYDHMSGTSMSAPVVSAVCGLTWSMNPVLNGRDIVQMVVSNTEGTAAGGSSYTTSGKAIVNARRSVEAAYQTRTEYYGYVVNAVDGRGIPDAEIKIHKGSKDGELVDRKIQTDQSGEFTLSRFPAGSYVMEISAQGFSVLFAELNVPEREEERCNVGTYSLTTELEDGAYRIQLRWGEYPEDLDSHFVANLEDGASYHVYFEDMEPQPGYANLDTDDVTSYGPETVTITDFGKLRNIKYAIHDYTNRGSTNSKALSNSGAHIEIYKGSVEGTNLIRSFDVPINMEGTEWDVFAMDANGTIIPINRMSYCEEPEYVLGSASGTQSSINSQDKAKGYEKSDKKGKK